jgi:hypothetical protein
LKPGDEIITKSGYKALLAMRRRRSSRLKSSPQRPFLRPGGREHPAFRALQRKETAPAIAWISLPQPPVPMNSV